MHGWLPDAHAEGPTPISAVLSGLLLNVALYAVLRFKMLMAGNAGAVAPGPLMIGMGLASLTFAAFMLYRRRDIKRLFAYSSIEHMGIITFAFGIGGPLANFAGLLAHDDAQPDEVGDLLRGRPHRADQGYAADRRNPGADSHAPVARLGPRDRRGRHRRHAADGHLHERIPDRHIDHAREPWLAVPLVGGLLVGFGALMRRVNNVAFGEPHGRDAPDTGVVRAAVRPSRHRAWRPASICRRARAWFQHIAVLLG